MFTRLVLNFKDKQFVRFVLVGIINTIFGYSIYALFIAIGLHYVYAVLLGTCVGILFNFKTFSVMVFRNNNNYLLLRFAGVYMVLYFVNIIIIKLAGYIVTDLYIRGAIAIIFTPLLSYFLNKKFVFTKQP